MNKLNKWLKTNSHLFRGCFLRNGCLLTTFLSDGSWDYRRADFWRKRAQRLLPQRGCDNFMAWLFLTNQAMEKTWKICWSHVWSYTFTRLHCWKQLKVEVCMYCDHQGEGSSETKNCFWMSPDVNNNYM